MRPLSNFSKVLIPAILILLAHLSNGQTTFIANNNPGATGGANTFTGPAALTNAMAAASNGDIIYVIPSPTSYGELNISKQLTLFGGGFNPDKDNPKLSILGNSRFDISASNVRISGFRVQGFLYVAGAITNLTIDKCEILQFINNGGTGQGNILIHNNIFAQNIANNQYVMNFGTLSSNIVITNNIIYSKQSVGFGLINSSDGTIVENNIFIGASAATTVSAFDNFNNGTVKNNIFYGVQPLHLGPGLFTNNNFENNLSFGATNNIFPTTNGNTSTDNIENVDPLFVNLPYGTAYNFSYDPNVQAGSMAIGNGEAGTDIGIFGGGSPFDLTGTPLPIIQVVDLPPTISQGSDLPVNIKGRGN